MKARLRIHNITAIIGRAKIVTSILAAAASVTLLIADYCLWGDVFLMNVALYLIMALGAAGIGLVKYKTRQLA